MTHAAPTGCCVRGRCAVFRGRFAGFAAASGSVFAPAALLQLHSHFSCATENANYANGKIELKWTVTAAH